MDGRASRRSAWGLGDFFAQVSDDLELYAAQLGWLHATPKAAKGKGGKESPRISQYGDPPLPDISVGEYLIGYWQQAGMVESSGFGALPLAYTSITGWQECTGIELDAWESLTIRQMSRAYCRALADGEDRNAPPPWCDMDAVRKSAVNDKIRAVFGARAKR